MFLKCHTKVCVCGLVLTYGHAVVVQLIPAALLTHSQTLLIQHVQQTDWTHLLFLVLHAADGTHTHTEHCFTTLAFS